MWHKEGPEEAGALGLTVSLCGLQQPGTSLWASVISGGRLSDGSRGRVRDPGCVAFRGHSGGVCGPVRGCSSHSCSGNFPVSLTLFPNTQ